LRNRYFYQKENFFAVSGAGSAKRFTNKPGSG
jgi:hypothetical protein